MNRIIDDPQPQAIDMENGIGSDREMNEILDDQHMIDLRVNSKEATPEDLQTMEMKEIGKEATEEEPPKVIYRGWRAMPYVLGNEAFQNLGTLGTSANLVVYLTDVFHMSSVRAATTINVFTGTTNLLPVLGAFLSDSYFGRYATVGFACIASFLGMLLLTLTAGIPSLHPEKHCATNNSCEKATTIQLLVLFASFALLIIGAGGIRPCNLAFGADQFDPHSEKGKRGINSFFLWYYFTFTFAVMVSSTIVIYIQSSINWALGLGIPTALMFISCVLFYIGTPLYVRVKPEGSPFANIAQVLVAAFYKHNLTHPDNPEKSLHDLPPSSSSNSKLRYSKQFRFLDRAAIITQDDEIKPCGLAVNPWRLCTLQEVEKVKCLIRIIPIWSAGIIFYIALVQQSTYVVFQALQFDRHLGNRGFQIPAASFNVFSMITLIVWVPLYDRILIPKLKKITGKEQGITLLQRMGIGFILGILSMVVSGVVEIKRKHSALHQPVVGMTFAGGAIASMSSLWLIPQQALFGLAEAFSIIGQIEFFYKQFPENMKSVAGSVLYLGFACSNYLSSLMVTIVHNTTSGNGEEGWLPGDINKGKLERFYFMIAIVGIINFIYFIICARWYKYKGIDDAEEVALESSKFESPQV